jgi:hypothetical protein
MLRWIRRRSDTTQSLIVSLSLGLIILGVLLVLRWSTGSV